MTFTTAIVQHEFRESHPFSGQQPLAGVLDTYETALIDAPVPTIVLTTDGEAVLINEAFTKATGFTAIDIPDVRQCLSKMRRIPANELDQVHDGWVQRCKVDPAGSREYSIWTKWDEMRCWIIHTTKPLIWIDKRRVVIQTIFDITEQRRLEAALRQSQEDMRVRLRELEALYASAPLGIGMLDSNLKFVRMNSAMAEISGVAETECAGRGVFDAQPDLRTRAERAMREVLETGRAVRDEEYQIESATSPGELRDLVEIFYPVRDAGGGTIGLGVISKDVTERRRAEDQAAKANAALRRTLELLFLALRTAGVSVFAQDEILRYTWIGGDLFGQHSSEAVGVSDVDVLPHDLVAPIVAMKKRVLKTGEPAHADLPYVVDGKNKWCNFRVEPWFDESGAVTGLLGAVSDISERKSSEQHVRTLMHELAHRSKNLLTVIQVMARRSAAPGLSSQDFVESFVERLSGIAQSHDLLARDDWRGISIHELMASQVGHLDDGLSTRFRISGPDVVLTAVAAQNLGMALHELATNAAKYGALSCQAGLVTVEWRFMPEGERTRLQLTWTERGGPPVTAPKRRGFGRLVIETIAGRALSGRVNLTFDPEGVVCRIDAAADDTVLVGNSPRRDTRA